MVITAAIGKFRLGRSSIPILCIEITPNKRVIITRTVMAMGRRTANFGKCMEILLKGIELYPSIGSGLGDFILPCYEPRREMEDGQIHQKTTYKICSRI